MNSKKTETVIQDVKLITHQLRLARQWSQTAISISLICLVLFLWSVNLIPGEFLFLVDSNRNTVMWISGVLGIISIIFGLITLSGYRYGRKELEQIVDKYDHS